MVLGHDLFEIGSIFTHLLPFHSPAGPSKEMILRMVPVAWVRCHSIRIPYQYIFSMVYILKTLHLLS